jgi:hypothetical protein
MYDVLITDFYHAIKFVDRDIAIEFAEFYFQSNSSHEVTVVDPDDNSIWMNGETV